MAKTKKNERNTENFFRKIMESKGISKKNGYIIEEQISNNPIIEKLLKNASKSGSGQGKPEFIITNPDYPELIVVVECKADIAKHESETKDKYSDYAVDGVLLYSKYLSKEFNVIGIAYSGNEENNCKFSSFLTINGLPTQSCIYNPKKKSTINELLTFEEYDDIIHYNPEKQQNDLNSVIKFTKKLHNYIYSNIPIEEDKKTLLVSGIILGLENGVFASGYQGYEKEEENRICEELLNHISISLKAAKMPKQKIDLMSEVFRFIVADKEILQDLDANVGKSKICHMIDMVKSEVMPFIKKYTQIDFIGHFYNEFIRYTGGDGKGLGIVLTPKHITEFMCDLVEVDKNSIVLDTCTGTAGFLISAMYKMVEDIKNSNLSEEEKEKRISHIKEKQMIGVEQNAKLFTMAASNMYFKGDGKTNLIHGDCFKQSGNLIISDKDSYGNDIKLKPNKALINPPYAQKNDNLKEIDFISFTLDQLQEGGRFACIVPMSVAIKTEKDKSLLQKKQNILSKHRLDAVFSMPNDLFYPVSTTTCIMVFSAYTKHSDDFETFFGYLKDDGFKITRKGRLDQGEWKNIENEYISLFKNKKNVAGKSVCKAVKAKDEWCAEAYMETDFSKITEEDFLQTIKNYVAFKLVNGGIDD